MYRLNRLLAVLMEPLRRLTRRTKAGRTDANEVNALVYRGDIAVLREQRRRRRADGWGASRYSCDSPDCRRLP